MSAGKTQKREKGLSTGLHQLNEDSERRFGDADLQERLGCPSTSRVSDISLIAPVLKLQQGSCSAVPNAFLWAITLQQ